MLPHLRTYDYYNVRKITFFDHVEQHGHVAPDPMLLAFRAAINWSRRHHQQMFAVAEPRELTDESEDDLDAIAMEDYLKWRDETQAARREKDIVGMSIGISDMAGVKPLELTDEKEDESDTWLANMAETHAAH
jgi:hypothetical protein